MKFSIIIPVYNVRNYIERCINSVIAQESENFDIECILVNDYTPDDSMDIINRMLLSYSGRVFFKIINHEKNKGLSAARNTGIESAEGSYLLFLDSDDHLVPGSLDLMFMTLQQYPNVDFVDGCYHSIKDGKDYPEIQQLMIYSEKETILKKYYMNDLVHSAWNKLLRRDFVVNNSLYFIEGLLFEDLEWSNRLFHAVSSFVIICRTTYIYEDNPASIMNSTKKNESESIHSFTKIINSLLETHSDKLYVEHRLFVFRSMLNALDINRKSFVDEVISRDLLLVRNRLFLLTIKDGRLFLVLFFLLMFEPFYSLLVFSFFRHQINRIEKSICYLANKVDCFHHII